MLGVRFGVDLGERDFGDDGVFAERRAAHIVIEGLAVVGEARGAVGHQALALRFANRDAQVGLAGQAELALAALGGVERNDVIARLDAGDALADLDDDARALMAENDRENALRIVAGQRESVGVAYPGMRDFDEHFTFLGRCDIDLDDFERLACLEGYGGARFHVWISLFSRTGPPVASPRFDISIRSQAYWLGVCIRYS